MYFILCFSFVFDFFINFFLWIIVQPFVYVNIYEVGAGITILMCNSDGLHPYFLCRKMEKTRSVKKEMDGEVFISRQSRHFPFIDNMNKIFFPIFT